MPAECAVLITVNTCTIMWITANSPPSSFELSPMGNTLMQAVTKNWLEKNSAHEKTKCLKTCVNLSNSLQRNPYEENLSILQSEQPESTAGDLSNIYMKTKPYINKGRLELSVNPAEKVCLDGLTGNFVAFDDLFNASNQNHNLVSDPTDESENSNDAQNVYQTDYHYFNSPDMEFGDDEIYSLPFGGTIEDNEKIAKSIYLTKFQEKCSYLNPEKGNKDIVQEKETENVYKSSFNNINEQRFNDFSHFNSYQISDHNVDVNKNTGSMSGFDICHVTESTHLKTFRTEHKHCRQKLVNLSETTKNTKDQHKCLNSNFKFFPQAEDSVERDSGGSGFTDAKEINIRVNNEIKEHEQSLKYKIIPKCKKQNLNENVKGCCIKLNSITGMHINLESANLLTEPRKCNEPEEAAKEEHTDLISDENVSLKSENCKESNKIKSNYINKPCDIANQQQGHHFKQNLCNRKFCTDNENVLDFQLVGKLSVRNLQNQHEQLSNYYNQHNSKKEDTVLRSHLATKKLIDVNQACKKNMILDNTKQSTIPQMFSNTQMKLSVMNKNRNNTNSYKRKSVVQGDVRKKQKFIAPLKTLSDIQENIEIEQFQVKKLNSENLMILMKKLNIQEVEKIAFTMIYSEGYTVLNKPPDNPKTVNSTPLGLVFYILWMNQSHEYYMLYLDFKIWEDYSLPTNFLHMILTSTYMKICFEAQTVFLFLLKILDIDHNSGKYLNLTTLVAMLSEIDSNDLEKQVHCLSACCWHVLDPLVGCWLLDPDNTPQNFMQTYMISSNRKEEIHVPPQYDNISQACYLLPFSCSTMDSLQQALTEMSLWSLFTELEMKIVPILAVMESCSICVTRNTLQELSLIFEVTLTLIREKAYKAAGKKFQINSAAELSQILYDDLQLDVKNNIAIRQTNFKKSKSTSEPMLRLLENSHPLPNIILEYRQVHKAKSTYIDGLLQYVNGFDNLTTTWKQNGTATGRLTSSNPNLQAIPKQPFVLVDHCQNKAEGNGKKIHLRALFISRTGYSFLAADFQNIEFRIFANYTKDEELLNIFKEDEDIFQTLSQIWLGSDKHEDREKTKKIVYSVMYGVGAGKLSEYSHVCINEAEKIMNSFIGAFPSLNILRQKVIDQCKLTRSVRSISGRQRLFPNINSENQTLRSQSERQAINFLIQGSAADICKAAMLNCARKVNEMQLDVKLLLQVHDELMWEVADYQVNLLADVVKCAMEGAGNFWCDQFQFTIPFPVAITVGKNWADMKLFQCN